MSKHKSPVKTMLHEATMAFSSEAAQVFSVATDVSLQQGLTSVEAEKRVQQMLAAIKQMVDNVGTFADQHRITFDFMGMTYEYSKLDKTGSPGRFYDADQLQELRERESDNDKWDSSDCYNGDDGDY